MHSNCVGSNNNRTTTKTIDCIMLVVSLAAVTRRRLHGWL